MSAGENFSFKHLRKRVNLGFPVRYVKGVIKLTFSLIWMKPPNCWKKVIVSQQQIPTGCSKLSPNPPLVDEVIDLIASSVNPTLPEHGSHESFSNKPLVEKVVESIPSSIDCTVPLESEVDTAQVLLVTSYPTE